MKKRDDAWIALAFGELDAAEAEEVTRGLAENSAAANRVREYAKIKNDLRMLTEVPDHQLSTERLREAILRKGLKASPRPNVFTTWLWAPTALCLAVFGLVMLRSKPAPIPAGSIQISLPAVSETPKFHSFVAQVTPPPAKPLAPVVSRPVPHALVAVKKTARPEQASPELLASVPPEASAPSAAAIPEPMPEADSVNQPMNSIEPPQADDTSDHVVLIGNQPDADTGANRAIEVESLSNVPISG